MFCWIGSQCGKRVVWKGRVLNEEDAWKELFKQRNSSKRGQFTCLAVVRKEVLLVSVSGRFGVG